MCTYGTGRHPVTCLTPSGPLCPHLGAGCSPDQPLSVGVPVAAWGSGGSGDSPWGGPGSAAPCCCPAPSGCRGCWAPHRPLAAKGRRQCESRLLCGYRVSGGTLASLSEAEDWPCTARDGRSARRGSTSKGGAVVAASGSGTPPAPPSALAPHPPQPHSHLLPLPYHPGVSVASRKPARAAGRGRTSA